ncbi:hypothetical protein ANN_28047 [Periplaneta americana]|uniref:DDE Tnp4 domain-containing protein n=1 Tax=Periplaneta americana TaxID=6978 RepID=A0ABQ8RUT9_PERAM|nr:hypothetical protein ANN_28047 [Periplaneta americana]
MPRTRQRPSGFSRMAVENLGRNQRPKGDPTQARTQLRMSSPLKQNKLIAMDDSNDTSYTPSGVVKLRRGRTKREVPLLENPTLELSDGYSTDSYPAFAHIGLRENPGKNLNQVICPNQESNPGHLVLLPDALTVTPQYKMDDDFDEFIEFYNENENENVFRPNKRYIRDMENPLEMYSDQQFKRRYRFNKNTIVDILVPLIENHNTTMRSLPISPLLKILVALRFYATASFQRQIPGHLLADSGYPQRSYIYTPVPRPVSQREQNYNNSLKITRSGVERTIGRWKRRFPCLYFEMQNKLRNVTRIITSCAILYNLGIQAGDLWEVEELEGGRDIIEIPATPLPVKCQRCRN